MSDSGNAQPLRNVVAFFLVTILCPPQKLQKQPNDLDIPLGTS